MTVLLMMLMFVGVVCLVYLPPFSCWKYSGHLAAMSKVDLTFESAFER